MPDLSKTILAALALVAWTALPAFAEPGAGGEDDISAKIQKQMDKIIELMEKNEQALLELSTGQKAKPETVDVKPPALPPEENGSSAPRGQGGEQGAAGRDAGKKLGELIRKQRQTADGIPGELEELVRMVPQ